MEVWDTQFCNDKLDSCVRNNPQTLKWRGGEDIVEAAQNSRIPKVRNPADTNVFSAAAP